MIKILKTTLASSFLLLTQTSQATIIAIDVIDSTSITTTHVGGDTIELITTAEDGVVQISGGFSAGVIGFDTNLGVFSAGLDLDPVDGSDDRSYLRSGVAFYGAVAGLNYASMDLDSDGVYETIVEFDFGNSITDTSDDVITGYAYDNTGAALLVSDAITALNVPEPSSNFLILLSGCFGLFFRRR